MNVKAGSFLTFFGIFWSAMTLLLDGFVLVPAARQLIAFSYPATQGTILTSGVKTQEDSEGGTTFGVSVSYTYWVGGHENTGARYRYDTSSSSDSAWAYAAVSARPTGAKVQVFYNPHNPQDSVLAPGLLGVRDRKVT